MRLNIALDSRRRGAGPARGSPATTDAVKDVQDLIRQRSKLQLRVSSARMTVADETTEVNALKSTRDRLRRHVRQMERTTCCSSQLAAGQEARLEALRRDTTRLKELRSGGSEAVEAPFLSAGSRVARTPEVGFLLHVFLPAI